MCKTAIKVIVQCCDCHGGSDRLVVVALAAVLRFVLGAARRRAAIRATRLDAAEPAPGAPSRTGALSSPPDSAEGSPPLLAKNRGPRGPS